MKLTDLKITKTIESIIDRCSQLGQTAGLIEGLPYEHSIIATGKRQQDACAKLVACNVLEETMRYGGNRCFKPTQHHHLSVVVTNAMRTDKATIELRGEGVDPVFISGNVGLRAYADAVREYRHGLAKDANLTAIIWPVC